jgi:hypothetical protein
MERLNHKQAAERIEAFILAVIKSGLRYDIWGPHSEIIAYKAENGMKAMVIGKELSDNRVWHGKIGFKFNDRTNTYHWFKFCLDESMGPYMSFDHSYSQATGKSKGMRGYRYRNKIYQSVAKLIGIHPDIHGFSN